MKVKPRKCKCGCGASFVPTNSMQPTTPDFECKVRYAELVAARSRAKREQEERASFRKRKEAIKSLSQLASEAQQYVNRYVRLRDRKHGCISCDRPASWNGQWHASHLKSVGANSFLRFHLWNIHKACSICNNHLSGNIAAYSDRLPLRIGQAKFEFIQGAPRERKYSREYLIRLKSIAIRACRRLEKRARS